MPALAVTEFYSPRNTITRAPVDFRSSTDGSMISGVTGGACLCTTYDDGSNPGAFGACTNSPAEIATASGAYYLQLTAAETNADYTLIKCTSNESMPHYARISHTARGVNWGEVDNETSTVGLSGTTVGTVSTLTDSVDVNLSQLVDGTLTLGCLLSAVNAVESGARTAVDGGGGSWTYTYRNPGNTQDRVVAQFNNNTGVRNQATITCP